MSTNLFFMPKFIFSFLFLSLFFACSSPNPNTNLEGKDELRSLEIETEINHDQMPFKDLVYVPIYSDIYVDAQNQNTLLSATLSIRNTSFSDSLFVSKIDYYNTIGELVRSYIDLPISINSMATVNYVIEREDDTGGSGANFIVELSSNNSNMKPIIQAIMIGENGNKGFSFSTDGYSLK